MKRTCISKHELRWGSSPEHGFTTSVLEEDAGKRCSECDIDSLSYFPCSRLKVGFQSWLRVDLTAAQQWVFDLSSSQVPTGV